MIKSIKASARIFCIVQRRVATKYQVQLLNSIHYANPRGIYPPTYNFSTEKPDINNNTSIEKARKLEYDGVNLLNENKIQEAITFFENALGIRSQATKEDNTEMPQLYDSLYHILSQSSELEKLLALEKHRLEIISKQFGDNSPSYGSCSKNIGHVLNLLKRYSEAKDYLSKASQILTATSSKTYEHAIELEALSADLLLCGQFKEGLSVSLQACQIFNELEKTQPEKFPAANAANAFLNLSISLHSLNEFAQAKEAAQLSVQYFKRLSYSHEDYPGALLKLGQACVTSNDIDAAESHLNNALELLVARKDPRPIDKVRIAETLDLLGRVYFLKAEYEKALGYQKRGFGMLRQIYGDDEFFVIVSQFYIGKNYLMLERYPEALAVYEKVLSDLLRLKIKDGEVVNVYCDMGTALYHLGRNKEALEKLIEGMNISNEVGGIDQSQLARLMYHTGAVYGALEQHENAVNYLRSALPIIKEIFGSDNELTKACRTELRKYRKLVNEANNQNQQQ